MKVVGLFEYRFRETIAILRYVLRMALKGDVTGVALCFRVKGKDQFAFTGEFHTDPVSALKATSRINWKMHQAIDAMDSTF